VYFLAMEMTRRKVRLDHLRLRLGGLGDVSQSRHQRAVICGVIQTRVQRRECCLLATPGADARAVAFQVVEIGQALAAVR
jgi:hypothetical protein